MTCFVYLNLTMHTNEGMLVLHIYACWQRDVICETGKSGQGEGHCCIALR